jgi:hypothetical protein
LTIARGKLPDGVSRTSKKARAKSGDDMGSNDDDTALASAFRKPL